MKPLLSYRLVYGKILDSFCRLRSRGLMALSCCQQHGWVRIRESSTYSTAHPSALRHWPQRTLLQRCPVKWFGMNMGSVSSSSPRSKLSPTAASFAGQRQELSHVSFNSPTTFPFLRILPSSFTLSSFLLINPARILIINCSVFHTAS